MNLEKYKNDGWGISRLGFEKLLEILNTYNKNINVIEFGSGKSTEFFDDYNVNINQNLSLISFDDNIKYAYESNNQNILVKIRNLGECNDVTFDNMFKNKKFNSRDFYNKKSELSTMQKNNFYLLEENDIVKKFDIVLLDGPNGNGRSIAFLHLINHLNHNAYIFIDDYTHYDFVEKFKLIFNFEIFFENKGGIKNQWDLGGDFIILKYIKNENI